MTDELATGLRLDVIGAGPAYTDRPGATGAAYLVSVGPTTVLLDLGQGSFPRLAAACEPSALDAVLISHLHPDHFIDLVALRHYLCWEFRPRRRVSVWAPAGIVDRLDALHAQPGFTAMSFDVGALVAGTMDIGAARVSAAHVTHTEDSFGFRVHGVDGGPGLVYSGDCGRAEDLDALIEPGDTLLVEVSFGPGPVTPGAAHLDGPAVGDLANRTGVGSVLLTHIQMTMDPAATLESVRSRFDGPVTFVQPGDRLAIG